MSSDVISLLPTEVIFIIFYDFLSQEDWPQLASVGSWSNFIIKRCWESCQYLDLGTFPLLRKNFLRKILNNCPKVRNLRFDCTYLNIKELFIIPEEIESLELESVDKIITHTEFPEILGRLKKLKILKISALADQEFLVDFNKLNNVFAQLPIEDLQIHRIMIESLDRNDILKLPEGLLRLKAINLRRSKLPTTLEKVHFRKLINSSEIYGLNYQTVHDFIKNCKKLHSITLIDYTGDLTFSSLAIQTISKTYPNLKKLKLVKQGKHYDKLIQDINLMVFSRNCISLLSLSLDNFSKITDAGVIEILGSCRELKKVSLNYTYITDDTLVYLSQLALVSLSLRSCTRISEQGLKKLLPFLPQLKSLNIFNVHGITDETLYTIEDSCSDIELLFISSPELTDASLKVISSLKKLKNLALNFCNFTDFTNLFNSETSKNLTTLSLVGATNLSNFDVKNLSENLKDLHKLSLQSCKCLDDTSLKYIAENMKKLRYLDIKNVHLTRNSLSYIPLMHKNLKFLKISKLVEHQGQREIVQVKEKFKILVEEGGGNYALKFKPT